jgi:dTDP-4-dehydrorhamnose reductase
MKILLLGKNGLLGSAIFGANKAHETIGLSHSECDICKTKEVESQISKISPDVVINATGYTAVDKAETEPDKAFEINSKAVGELSKILAEKNIPLMHFSTDYIFDGSNPNGYKETDLPSPQSVYGKSKAAGEVEIFKNLKNYYLIRTSWLYGPGGKNFVDTMIELHRKNDGKPIKVVNDQRGCPTYSIDLANAVLGLLQAKKYGIYHMVNDSSCTWYEFAVEIFRQLGVNQPIDPITTKELNRPAPRPACSILLNTKLPKLRSWQEALEDYLSNKTLIL